MIVCKVCGNPATAQWYYTIPTGVDANRCWQWKTTPSGVFFCEEHWPDKDKAGKWEYVHKKGARV